MLATYIFQEKTNASMNAIIKLPFYAKVSLIFLGFFAFVSMLFIGQGIIVPLIYSTILAIVLGPVVDWFVKRKMNRIIAITITLLLVIVLAFSIIAFLGAQVSKFSESFPIMISKLRILLENVVVWISNTFHVRSYKIENWLIEMKNEILNNGKSAIGQTLIYTGNALVILVLIPVYIFMILYYQPLLLEFIYRLFKTEKVGEVNEVLLSTKRIIKSYLVGLLIEAFLIASLNSISLLILGIDYAVLLGVIGAIVNIIPYIGGALGVSLPFVMALTTKPSFSYAFMVLCAYIVIQFIDNHYIVPKIVASKVKINALVSVIVVLTGSALWGIPGMLISIPLTAIIKVICDHIEGLKAWGFLLGDNMSVFALPKLKSKK
jgi:predicted PurR-regulated permease PerM